MEFKFRICCYKAAAAEFITKHRHRPISNIAKSSLPLHRPIVGCQGRNGKELQSKNVIFFFTFAFFLFNKNSNQAQAQKFDCISNVEETSNCQTSEAGFELAVAPYVGGGISFFKVWKVFTNLQLHYFSTSSPFISLT